jgi:hypothetical protein
MPIVTRKVHDLINYALKLTGEYSIDDPTDGQAVKEGLEVLNMVLDGFAVEGYQIPFYKEFSFSLSAGVRDYKIRPGTATASDEVENNRIIDVVSLVINDGYTDYPVYELPINANELNTAINQSQGRPETFSLTKFLQDSPTTTPYSRIRFYPYPSTANTSQGNPIGFTAKVRANCYLEYLELGDTLDGLPAATHLYLAYELANQLVNFYPSSEQNWTAKKQGDYERYRREFLNQNPVDLTITNSGVLMTRNGWYQGRLRNG